MRNKSFAKHMSGTVREILGTCFSVGCTVEGQSPQDISAKVASGEIEIPVRVLSCTFYVTVSEVLILVWIGRVNY